VAYQAANKVRAERHIGELSRDPHSGGDVSAPRGGNPKSRMIETRQPRAPAVVDACASPNSSLARRSAAVVDEFSLARRVRVEVVDRAVLAGASGWCGGVPTGPGRDHYSTNFGPARGLDAEGERIRMQSIGTRGPPWLARLIADSIVLGGAKKLFSTIFEKNPIFRQKNGRACRWFRYESLKWLGIFSSSGGFDRFLKVS
jgi:hypothetical protein